MGYSALIILTIVIVTGLLALLCGSSAHAANEYYLGIVRTNNLHWQFSGGFTAMPSEKRASPLLNRYPFWDATETWDAIRIDSSAAGLPANRSEERANPLLNIPSRLHSLGRMRSSAGKSCFS